MFHFIHAGFVIITNMTNNPRKTSPSSPPCEGGERGVVISSDLTDIFYFVGIYFVYCLSLVLYLYCSDKSNAPVLLGH